MPLLPGCPGWDYEYHPDHRAVLQREVAALLVDLRRGAIDHLAAAMDTRDAHRRLFGDLACPDFSYYAGNYRGSAHYCLRDYTVGVQGDPRVGAPPGMVDTAMTAVATFLGTAFVALDAKIADPAIAPVEKLKYGVAVAACAFEWLLRVHPYANGNGHAARFCVWAILGRYGFWPSRWSIDPRPPLPTYADAIVRYRNGEPEPLERLILSCI